MWRGLLMYFPAILGGIANISHIGNEKHNKGQPMHHARSKSNDHGDCVVRHLTDVGDYLAAIAELERLYSNALRNYGEALPPEVGTQYRAERDQLVAAMLLEVRQLGWRALAFGQELEERFGGAPMAPAAKP
jgi:hypothetical protein